MKMLKAIVLMFVAAVFISGCGGSTKSGKVLVEVNGSDITEGDIDFLGEINPRIKRQIETPDGKQRIVNNLVEQDLLYQKAMKEGLNRDALVKAKVDLYRKVIIAQSLVEKSIEDAAKKYYEDNPDQFKKLKMSQIEIKFATPEEMKKAKDKGALSEEAALKKANEIKAEIEGGLSFEEAAKKYSEDPITKARGGNVGLVSMDDKRLIARGYEPLLKKAFEIKVGEIAGPIKTADGYHLITVTRGVELEPYAEVEQAILFKVKNEARDKLLADLKKDAKIVYPEEAAKKKEAEKAADTKPMIPADQEKFKEALKKLQEQKQSTGEAPAPAPKAPKAPPAEKPAAAKPEAPKAATE